MATPYELQLLQQLRRRGQCPQLPVFVGRNWDWHRRLLDFGCLSIRVRDAGDTNHDWSPLAGMFCFLLRDGPTFADLGAAMIAAGPSQMETFDPTPPGSFLLPSRVVVGRELAHCDKVRRDRLLERLLRHG